MFLNVLFDLDVSKIPYLDLGISIALIVVLDSFLIYLVKRRFVIIADIVLSLGFIACRVFNLIPASYVALAIYIVFIVSTLYVNVAETRYLLANNTMKKKFIPTIKKDEVEKIFDHDVLYKTINETVLYLSKNKIGALLTFERKDKLQDIIKNGSKIDAPVTFEILVTIFYPGTRLHDGAVVICGNKIVAASVYYTPTTKPLTGKYGSRHRAALGISEISDAVTVVVSEETGRISIAYNGILESYSPDNFYKAFENIMNETDMPAE